MESFVEKRICREVCVLNGIARMLQKAYDDSILSKTYAGEWYKLLKYRRVLFRSGQPSTSTTDNEVSC